MNLHARPTPAARAGYYASAATWASDVNAAMRRSRNTAWVVAGVAAALAILQGLALLLLLPLKTLVPYAFVVDRQSGYIELARPLQGQTLSENTAVTQSYLAQYVMARETFDAADLKPMYRKTILLSAGKARSDYIREMAASNPASPLHIYHRTTQVRVVIKSITLIGRDTALVRFDTERTDLSGQPQRASFLSTISFRYTPRALTGLERFDNPLGFEVDSYRRDTEFTGAAAPIAG